MEKKELLIKIQDLFIYFFISSFLGWFLEVAYAFSVYGTYVDRGFLHGPICPIYGYGAVAMVLIIEWIEKKKIKNVFAIYGIITIIATVLEYIASVFLEVLFHLRWWDYTDYFLNINGRICLYGYGAVAMVLIIEWIEKKKIKNVFAIYGIITIIATVLEYIASVFLEVLFHLRWWDYTDYFLNINGRICLIFSLFFGLAGIFFMKVIYPRLQTFTKTIRKHFSNKNIWIILICLTIIMTIDKGLSALKYWNPKLENVDFRVVLKKKNRGAFIALLKLFSILLFF